MQLIISYPTGGCKKTQFDFKKMLREHQKNFDWSLEKENIQKYLAVLSQCLEHHNALKTNYIYL